MNARGHCQVTLSGPMTSTMGRVVTLNPSDSSHDGISSPMFGSPPASRQDLITVCTNSSISEDGGANRHVPYSKYSCETYTPPGFSARWMRCMSSCG